MLFPIKDYQFKALERIKSRFRIAIKESKDSGITSTIVFKSPTGSGKTFVVSYLINELCEEFADENICFIWACPGKGELHVQSYNAVRRYVQGNPVCTLLEAEFFGTRSFIKNKEIVFINWEKLVQKDKETGEWINSIMKDQEGQTFLNVLDKTKENGTKIILIIDESHIGASAATRIQEFKNLIIKPDITLEMSATPLREPSVDVDIEDVIAEGMIKKEVIVNQGITKDDKKLKEVESQELILSKGYEKQEELKTELKKINEKVIPLTLIQIPNTDAGEAKKIFVRDFLRERGITEENGKLKFWCDKHEFFDKEGIKKNDDETEYLVFKTAVATGWDCPRAHILVKFRETNSETFETQTIGRILRTANAHSYDNDLLDCAYIFTNTYVFSTNNDTYNPNKIKTEFTSMRPGYNMNSVFNDTQLESYYRSRQGAYNSANSQFSKYFINSFMKYFELTDKDKEKALLDYSSIEEKFKKKGMIIDIRVEDAIIEEKKLDISEVEKQSTQKADYAQLKMSQEDIEARYYSLIKENLNDLAYVRSKGTINAAIINCFGIFYNAYSRENKISLYQKLVVINENIFAQILSDATLNFRNMLSKNSGKTGETYLFKIANTARYSIDTHVQYEAKNSLMQPLYIAKKGNGKGGTNQLECDFIDYIDDKVEWFWQNGIGDVKTNFGIKNENGLSTFRPDFIIKFKNGTIGIFDTKPIGYNVDDTKTKAESLYKYISDLDRSGKPKVIGGIVVQKGTQFYYYLEKEYIDMKQSNENWKNFNDLFND